MNFPDYFRSLTVEQRQALAEKLGTSIGHLRNVAYGFRTLSDQHALAVERESGGACSLAELSPALAAAIEASGYAKPEAA